MIPVMRILDGDRLIDINASSFSNFTLGIERSCDYRFAGQDPGRKSLEIIRHGSRWTAEITSPIESLSAEVEFDRLYILSRKYKQGVKFFYIDESFHAAAEIQSVVSIGRGQGSTIVLPETTISRHHADICLVNGYCRIIDQHSRIGTYVNGIMVQDAVLKPDDIITIGNYYFKFDGTTVFSWIPEKLIEENRPVSSRPLFKPSPRIISEMESETVEIEPPPSIGYKPGFNISSLLYPIGGVNYLLQGGSYKKRQKLQLKTYSEYISALQNELNNRHDLQRAILNDNHPAPSVCVEWSKNTASRLWERSCKDDDFLHLRVGCGTVASQYLLKAPEKHLSLAKEPLLDKAADLAKESVCVKNAPLRCNFNTSAPIGIIGNPSDRLNLLNNLMVEAATLHSYQALKIAGFMPKKQRQLWQWMRWLPHCFSEDRQMRFLAENRTDAAELTKALTEVLSKRNLESQNSHFRTLHTPFYLVIIADPYLTEQSPILDYLAEHDSDLQYAVVYLADSVWDLPKECGTIIEAKQGNSVMYAASAAQNKQTFIPDQLSVRDCDVFGRKLAPLRLDSTSSSTPLPVSISFLEGYGVKQVSQLDIEALWAKNTAYRSMSVPIGVLPNNELFYFDIHEKKHGPNGVVAGMVGSGKTEMMQSWILSMAVNFSPQDVSFVLVDFKGTGLLRPFRNLPHVAGMISDLDTNIARNLVALENELERREKIFANAHMSPNILKYKEAYAQGKVSENLPFLMIVVDEYAEFKKRFPDFTSKIESIFCRGRSLGVYMILMTQSPSGIVTSQMENNNRFRWCLKVANSEASREMLKHTDAANIRYPGRAYVQVGQDEVYTQIQSFYSGAPYRPYAKSPLSKAAPISVVDLLGRRSVYMDDMTSTGFRSSKTEIDAVVEYVSHWCQEHSIPSAQKVWSETLPSQIPLNTLIKTGFDGQKWATAQNGLCPVIGLVDDPRQQTQYPLHLDLSGAGHALICGMPGSGKTTLLQTLVMSTAIAYAPDEVQMYLMDFGSWSLGMFQKLPHVGGVANDNEDEKIQKLVQLLTDELNSRRYKFSNEGVGTLSAYRQLSGEKLPYILLVLDNMASVLSLYPELEGFFTRLTREGGNYGILLVTTASNMSGVWFKIRDKFTIKASLQQTDKTVYQDIVGKTGGLVPDYVPGRGLISLTNVVEFQAAMPADGQSELEVISGIRRLCQQMNDAWSGSRPKMIPVMPSIISFGSVADHDTAIGLCKKDLSPASVSFHKNHCLIISGTPGSGKSNLLKVLAKQLFSKGTAITAFTRDKSSLSSVKNTLTSVYTTGEEMDAYMEQLLPELQRRKTVHDADPQVIFDTIAILIDGWKQCFDLISNQTAKRLEMVVRLASGLGVYLILAEDAGVISSLYNQGESVVSSLVGKGTAVLLGGNFRAHTAFDADLTYSEKDRMLGQHEGYLIKEGHASHFKTMYEE